MGGMISKARGAASSRADMVKRIRKQMGRTQAELGTALSVSTKAVESYEQGWRQVPVRVMIQLLVLLAIHRRHPIDDLPCWKIRRCSRDARDRCPSYTIGDGHFCWFVGAGSCRPARDNNHVLPCMGCPVIRRLLKPAPRPTPAA
jgi:DNA-binding XRE family transcriptional regulator